MVLLFFHANAEDLGMCFSMLKHMRDQFKVNVMAIEYPGYGLLSKMNPSEDLCYEVSLTVFRYLVDVAGVRYSQIVLCGRSLGSGPAVHLASKYPVSGLILVSPFSSIKGAVRSIAGRFAALGFAECFPNDRVISNVSCPTLFIHGERDDLIPMEHSVRLFKRCRARKLLVAPPSMEHNSNLFGDASYMAVPVIHFFGFPGYYTDNPPRLPSHIFERIEERQKQPQHSKENQNPMLDAWFCGGCLTNRDTHHVDIPSRDRPYSDGCVDASIETPPVGLKLKPNEVPPHDSTDEDPALGLEVEAESSSTGNSGGAPDVDSAPHAVEAPLREYPPASPPLQGEKQMLAV
jgi:dienelactone hydrolase